MAVPLACKTHARTYKKIFECQDIKPYVSIGLPRAPVYFKMLQDLVEMTKLQHDATLECKWEAFKIFLSHVQTNVFWLCAYLA